MAGNNRIADVSEPASGNGAHGGSAVGASLAAAVMVARSGGTNGDGGHGVPDAGAAGHPAAEAQSLPPAERVAEEVASDRAWTPWSDPPRALRDHGAYNVGDMSPFNTPIARIYGRSRDYLIYLTETGTLTLNFNEPVPAPVRPALREFRRLTTTATIALVQAQQRAAVELIAAGLNSAFAASDSDDALAGLLPAKTFIETRAADHARSNFLLFVTASSVLVFGVLYFLRYHLPVAYLGVQLREIILGGMAGIVGATISLVQRSETLRIDPLSSPLHRAFHGTMRAMLGMVFGAVVVVLAHSDFAFGSVKDNVHALFFMALVGGFSERLVPDLISRVTQQEEAASQSTVAKGRPAIPETAVAAAGSPSAERLEG